MLRIMTTIDKKIVSASYIGHLSCDITIAPYLCCFGIWEKAFKREQRTIQNCPKWPWFFILVSTSCSTRIIFYRIFYCYFYSSHLHTFFSFSLSCFCWIQCVFCSCYSFFSPRLVFSAGWMAFSLLLCVWMLDGVENKMRDEKT